MTLQSELKGAEKRQEASLDSLKCFNKEFVAALPIHH